MSQKSIFFLHPRDLVCNLNTFLLLLLLVLLLLLLLLPLLTSLRHDPKSTHAKPGYLLLFIAVSFMYFPSSLSALVFLSNHFRSAILCRHQLINICCLIIVLVIFYDSDPYSSTDMTLELNSLSLCVCDFHTLPIAKKAALAFCVFILIFLSVPWLMSTLLT